MDSDALGTKRGAGSVLIVAPHPFYSERGTPIAVREIASILRDQGHSVTILTLPFGEDPDLPGVEVVRVRRIPFLKTVGIGFSAAKLWADLFLWIDMVRLLRKQRFAVYHPVEEAVFLCWFARIFFRARIVYDMDSCMGDQIVEKFSWLGFLRPVFRFAERFVMRRVDHILPVCPALGEIAKDLAPRTPQTVLHDVPPAKPDVVPESLLDLRQLVGAEGPIALYVGNFERYQGVDCLLSAMEKINSSSPLRLVLIGGGADSETIRKRIDAASLKGRVSAPGPQPLEHLPFLLEQADILVSPRIKGVNTPMKVYSYLQSGRAILATRIVSHTQVLGEEHVCLVDPTPESIAEGLEILGNDPALRERLGAAAGELSRTCFSREALRRKVKKAYDTE